MYLTRCRKMNDPSFFKKEYSIGDILSKQMEQSLYISKKKTRKRKRKSVPKALKDKLWDTTFGPDVGQANCYVCDIAINSKRFEAGHIISVVNGGKTVLDNLRCICGTCNKSMGTDNLEQFRTEYFPNPEDKPIMIYESVPYSENKTTESYRPILLERSKSVVLSDDEEQCWICCEDIRTLRKWDKKYIDCGFCGKMIYHYDCWKGYLQNVSNILGRSTTFMRITDCLSCLDLSYQIMNR